MIDRYKLYYRTFFGLFWCIQVFLFVSTEIIKPLIALHSLVMLIGDVIIVALGISAMAINRNRGDNVLVSSFVVIAIVSTIFVNHEGFTMLINGLRDFVGLLFVMPILRYFITNPKYGNAFVKSFDSQLMTFLWVQAFCATWQFIEYGAWDYVGGTVGSSGALSTCVYVVSFYLMIKRWNNAKNYFHNLWQNRVLVFLLYPSFLNETKISFIYLVVYFILLIQLNRTAIIKIALAVPILILLMFGVGSFYLDVTNQDADRLLSSDFYDEYLFGGNEIELIIELGLRVQDGTIQIDPSEMWSVDIPRFAKIFMMPQALEDSNGGVAFGAGLGHFKGGQMVEMSYFARVNQWLLRGSRPWLFIMFIGLGIPGVIWYACSVIRMLSYKGPGYPLTKNFKIYLTMIIVLFLFYHEAWRYVTFCIIMIYLAMGCVLRPDNREEYGENVIADC